MLLEIIHEAILHLERFFLVVLNVVPDFILVCLFDYLLLLTLWWQNFSQVLFTFSKIFKAKIDCPLPPSTFTLSSFLNCSINFICWIAFGSISNSFFLDLNQLLSIYDDFWCIDNPANILQYNLHLTLFLPFLFLHIVLHHNQWTGHWNQIDWWERYNFL